MEETRLQQGLNPGLSAYEQLYFKHYFNQDLIHYSEDGSFMHVQKKILNLHDKKLRVSYITPALAYSEASMCDLLETLEHRDLITLIRSDKNDFLESHGFEAVIDQQVCNIPTQMIPEFDIQGIVLDPPSQDLKTVYDTYSAYFTGYFSRNVQDFDRMKRDAQFLNGKYIGYMQDQKLLGYLRIINHPHYVEVLESCYDKSGTLLRLLSFIAKGKNRIIYRTNSSEKIQKLLPHIKVSNETVILARVNDKELFERLFHIKIISSYSAFNAFSKPVLNTDMY